MTRRRFYAPPSAFDWETQIVTLDADEARHLRDVLRLKPRDAVYVFDGAGLEYRCIVKDARRDSAELWIDTQHHPAKPESQLQLKLGVALLKGEKFDLVVQKATELGVQQIVPVITRHADIHLRDKSDAAKRIMRWQRIALEAAKQSGRAVVPIIAEPEDIGAMIRTSDHSFRLMFSEKSGKEMGEISTSPTNDSVLVLVGPEGGWADEEVALALEFNWDVVTLGGRTLRAETAAIVAITLVQHKWGDLK